MYGLMLMMCMSVVPADGVIMTSEHGYLKVYTQNHLTVDNTWRNKMILKRLRSDHNHKFVSKYFPKPKITTHGGNGYMKNINPYDKRFHKYMIHDSKRFERYLKYKPLEDPLLLDYLKE